ncbi:MAG TPA: NADPH-dependent F420 reductase [Steroidobacteraceae bacterium]
MTTSNVKPTIAVLGGTGHLGGALAQRWAQAGFPVILGSRDAARAADAAAGLAAATGALVRGLSNREAAAAAEIVVITVPFATQQAVLEDIRSAAAGKLVVDTTVPLVPPKVMRVQLPPEGSAAVRAQQILGTDTTVVSAFHNVAAHKLATADAVDCDVLVFGDQKEARERVVTLAIAAGLRGLHAGSLANSAAAEALTSILIFINKAYAVDGAGLRITGELKSGA